MNIIRHGFPGHKKLLRGECQKCGCRIECVESETKELVDRDTQPGMATRHVACPDCKDEFLWVK